MIINRIKEYREMNDIKQKDVAKALNVHFSTVSGWENGNDTMPLTRIISFANHYKISLDYIFEISSRNNYVPLTINPKTISENLLRLRKANNMTQQEVSRRLNISTGTYCDYENGKNLIKTNALYGLTTIYKPFSLDKIFKK